MAMRKDKVLDWHGNHTYNKKVDEMKIMQEILRTKN
jgi:hypothetical protein